MTDADLIEAIVAEMREWRWSADRTPMRCMHEWAGRLAALAPPDAIRAAEPVLWWDGDSQDIDVGNEPDEWRIIPLYTTPPSGAALREPVSADPYYQRGYAAGWNKALEGLSGASPAQGWIRAVDEEMVVTHLGVANADDNYEVAKKKLHDLICWHVAVATDERVNGGFKLVPVEPAQGMVINGFECEAFDALMDAVNEARWWPYSCRQAAELVTAIYRAMLDAAPPPPAGENHT